MLLLFLIVYILDCPHDATQEIPDSTKYTSETPPQVVNLESGLFDQERPSDPPKAKTIVPCSIGTTFGARYELAGVGHVLVRSVWRTPGHSTTAFEQLTLVADRREPLEARWRIEDPCLQRIGVYELYVEMNGATLIGEKFVIRDCP